MNDISVYQLSYGHIGQSFGYIFPSESIESSSQSLVFALALPTSLFSENRIADISHFLSRGRVRFPCDIKGEQINLEAKFNEFYTLSFYVEDSKSPVSFDINIFQLLNPNTTLSYIGNYENFLPNDCYILQLLPKNVKTMNELYISKGFTFVGTTPVFGKPINYTRYN